jgi:F-box and WD-40 domain protein 1/11
VDLRRAADMDLHPRSGIAPQRRNVRATLGKTWEFDLIDIGAKAKRLLGLSSQNTDAPITSAPLRLDWRILYRERLELDRRWSGTVITRADDAAKAAGISTWRMGGVYDPPSTVSASVRSDPTSEQGYEPVTTKIAGHTDR